MPEQEIADLDFSLQIDGQLVTLTRGAASVECWAFVRDLAMDQVADTVAQQTFHIIMSPTQIDEASWPAAIDSPAPSIEARIPIKGDKLTIAGRSRTVQSVLPFFVSNILVRIEMKATG
jgi:hypothetical protein